MALKNSITRICSTLTLAAVIAIPAWSQATQPQPAQSQAGGTQGTPPPKVTTPDVKIPGNLSLPGPAQSEIGAQPLSISEAVAIALKKQPQVLIAQANILAAQGRVQQTASSLLPQFGANASYNNQASIVNSGPVLDPFAATVSVQQLLFDFGRTRDLVRQQSALERSVRWSLTRTQQSIAMQVKSAFYDLVQNLANVKLSEDDVATRQKELDEANARMNNGLGAPVDVLQAKTNLADGAVSLSTARNAAFTSQLTLAQLMGINPRTPIVPAPAKETPLADEGDMEKLVTAAMTSRPDIKTAMEQVAAATYAVSGAQKGNLPRVDAIGGMNGRGPNDPFATEAATYGIVVTWLFGDGGLTAGQVKEARGNEDAAKQNLIVVTNQAIADVGQAFVDLQSAIQRLDLAGVGTANAQELVRVDLGRYTGGIGQFLDVTTAQSALFTAQRSLTQAQGDVERARARLRAAVGLL
jgi:outer membrane protein TolC